jgi:hypothetical protein
MDGGAGKRSGNLDHFGKEKTDDQIHHSKIDDDPNQFSEIHLFLKRLMAK